MRISGRDADANKGSEKDRSWKKYKKRWRGPASSVLMLGSRPVGPAARRRHHPMSRLRASFINKRASSLRRKKLSMRSVSSLR